MHGLPSSHHGGHKGLWPLAVPQWAPNSVGPCHISSGQMWTKSQRWWSWSISSGQGPDFKVITLHTGLPILWPLSPQEWWGQTHFHHPAKGEECPDAVPPGLINQLLLWWHVLEQQEDPEGGPTHWLGNKNLNPSILNLIFILQGMQALVMYSRKSPSDHAAIWTTLTVNWQGLVGIPQLKADSEEEAEFHKKALESMLQIIPPEGGVGETEWVVGLIAKCITSAWNSHARVSRACLKAWNRPNPGGMRTVQWRGGMPSTLTPSRHERPWRRSLKRPSQITFSVRLTRLYSSASPIPLWLGLGHGRSPCHQLSSTTAQQLLLQLYSYMTHTHYSSALCWLMTDDLTNLILTNLTADSPMLTDPWLWNSIYFMDLFLLANTLGLCSIPNSI